MLAVILHVSHDQVLQEMRVMSELNTAIKQFKPNKTPGNTGLTAEFFQFCWKKLAPLYLDALNYAKKQGLLSLSARRGVISLIPKSGKNSDFLKNWRPLTMLNFEYKLLAKATLHEKCVP